MAYVSIADRDHEIEHHDPQTFVTKYIYSQDHKVIAIQYGGLAILIGLVGMILSSMFRLQLGFPDTFDFINPENYLQFVSTHGMIMVIYLLTALFLGGFGNYLIPLQLGSRDMVFPFMNMLSVWVYALSVLILIASFFVPGGATGAGWTLYPPQAISPGTPGVDLGIILMLLSLAVFIVAFTMGGLNYVTTVLQARCRGMTLMRMPLSIWGIFMATILGLLAFPALLVSAIMMLLDKTLGTSFFMPAMMAAGEVTEYGGGSPVLFQHLFWFFGHPEVYIVALPAFGIGFRSVQSVHARKNIFGYRMMVWAILAIGGLSFIVWAHHMYVSGMNPYFGFFFATTTLIIAVPTALKVYNWVLTLWQGDIHLRIADATLPSDSSLPLSHGGLTGLFLGNVTIDLPLSDTYFVVAHFHMVMGVSPVLVVFGAIYHWYPKMTGRMYNETLGKWHFWLTFLGTYAIYLPMHYIGFLGVPRRYYAMGNYRLHPGFSYHAKCKHYDFGIDHCCDTVNLLLQHHCQPEETGKKADGNPWKATSLEWQTPDTPPKHGNWGHEAAGSASLGLRLCGSGGCGRLHAANSTGERGSCRS